MNARATLLPFERTLFLNNLAMPKGEDGKTVRSLKIGALWASDGNRPGRIHLEAIPTNFSGYLVFWPLDEKEDTAE